MSEYSPFDKHLKDLAPGDLRILREVHEGWYVEYKSQPMNARAFAKAVSAFANTYGGWLFIGIEEKSKDESVAHNFPGIAEVDVDSVLQRFQQAVADHLNPVPFFEICMLRGPCREIGLTNGHSIVVVNTPSSHTAPHIHSDGRIYRRVADGSEPKPETDRYLLDQLWRRGDSIREATRKWVEGDPEFSQAEEHNPYIRLLLCVDPWRQRVPWLDVWHEEIRNILINTEENAPSVAFDVVHTTAEGIMARQVGGNDPHAFGLTWRMQRDMLCEVVFPIRLYRLASLTDLSKLLIELDGYAHGEDFLDILKNQKHIHAKIADLNFLMNLLVASISKYRRFLDMANLEKEFYFKSRLLNVWRVSPFVDEETILGEFQKFGIPVISDNVITMPIGSEPETFTRVEEYKSDDLSCKEFIRSRVQATVIFVRIAAAFGIPMLIQKEDGMKMVNPTDLEAAGGRATIVQENRTKRECPR